MSQQLETLVERATRSELFTAPRLAADLDRFLRDHGDRCRELAREARSTGVETAFFVGSGGSWSSMYSGKYLCDRLTTLASDVILSYELVWRTPRRLGPKSIVFVASYSGGTEDTLAALRHAKAAGARTVALVRSADSVIGREADACIAYDAPALYALPMAAVTLFALEWAKLEGNGAADAVADGMGALPGLIADAYANDKARGEQLAREYLPATLLYCVGSGPLYGLAYKFALTVFMENIRTHGSIVEGAEFRHGPAEMLERQRPEMAFLLGSDESRALTARSLDVARRNGARTFVFDAADYAGLHPLLAPFVLKVPLQWFVVYSALLRGIDDLDERVLMGRNVLAEGREATWP
jgi:fructoselysine-6-P-deglycase FrlB-like protein